MQWMVAQPQVLALQNIQMAFLLYESFRLLYTMHSYAMAVPCMSSFM